MEENKLRQIIKEETLKTIREYMKSSSFTDRKLTDTPTDSLSVVNRKYVTLNGAVTSRPSSSVTTVGQRYFATDTNIPMTWNGTNWVNGAGSVVAVG